MTINARRTRICLVGVGGFYSYDSIQYQRTLVARTNIRAGELFTRENVTLKRPLPGRLGLQPQAMDEIRGKRAMAHLRTNDPVTREVVAS